MVAIISRIDAYFGNPIPFNQTVFDRTLAQWTEDTINITTSAAGRAVQVRNSEATNPEFSLSQLAQGFTTGESIAFILVFGDVETGVAPKSDIVYWFGKWQSDSRLSSETTRRHHQLTRRLAENEQFPPGYAPPAGVVNSTNLLDLQAQLAQALLDQGVNISAAPAPTRRSVHVPEPLW